MKDIPVFTGSHGIASLVLREIPLRGEGYILIRTVFDSLDALVRECDGFCRMAGAERCYVLGKSELPNHREHARLIERSVSVANLPQTTAVARPCEDADEWLKIYRERFRNVPVATSFPAPEGLFDIYDDKEYIGIGQLSRNKLLSVAALQRGRGADCVSAMAKLCADETLVLQCVEQNLPAMRLYDKLGFSRGNVQEVWYCTK